MPENAGILTIHPASDGGATGRAILAKEWADTSLGPYDLWPQSLKNYLHLIQTLPGPAALFWGRSCIQLYNDGYALIMGPKHPGFLGQRYIDCWPEAEAAFYPLMLRVLDSGERVEVKDNLFPVTRRGFLEEAYFTFSFLPLRDEQGVNAGILHLVNETTETIVADRRSLAVRLLSQQTVYCKTDAIALSRSFEILAQNTADLPFCAVYLHDSQREGVFHLARSTGLTHDQPFLPLELTVHEPGSDFVHDVSQAVRERQQVQTGGLLIAASALSHGFWPEAITNTVVSPIALSDQQSVMGFFLTGVSPRLSFDERYKNFLQLLTAQMAAMLGAARAYEEERKTIEGMTNVDRARTAFFANVSHELRTPLTLILAPIEAMLDEKESTLTTSQAETLQIVHNNAVRLLQMVGSLLDFAKLAAEKVEVKRVPVDIAVLTKTLFADFEPAMRAKEIIATFECREAKLVLGMDAYLYERIVFNLLANAVKFTGAKGTIAVSVSYRDGQLTLKVRDTGIGIAPADCEKLFQKFHQVEGSSTRRYEGTGLGLALVREFTQLLGGEVAIASKLGEGSTFTMTCPAPELATQAAITEPLARATPPQKIVTVVPEDRLKSIDLPRVLLAEDNPELAAFIGRILLPTCRVILACDGEEGLALAKKWRPHLVISDVMMPKMNGFDLTKAIKADKDLEATPVILLTAMTNRESLLQGWNAGANDYLFKPFHPRELEARVSSLLAMVKWREKSEALRKRKEELESFSHMASHDLREPLRKISAFADMLAGSLQDNGDEQVQHCLRVIGSSSARMTGLIEALIEYSRMGSGEMPLSDVDLNRLVADTVHDFGAESDRAAVVFGELPVLQTVPEMMGILFRNILENCLKYRHPSRPLAVHVKALREGDFWHFEIADNGIGFEKNQCETIFIMFKRLHLRDVIPGDGMGLAICRRIVETLGGSIWAVSEMGIGSSFHFTLPVG